MGDTGSSCLGVLSEILGAQSLVKPRCRAQKATAGLGIRRVRESEV